MNIAFVLEVLNRIGFSTIGLTADTKVLGLQELLAEKDTERHTFIEYISNPEANGLSELCADQEFLDLLLRSLIEHDFLIPKQILQAIPYEMVFAKDKKRLIGDVKNGLYSYI